MGILFSITTKFIELTIGWRKSPYKTYFFLEATLFALTGILGTFTSFYLIHLILKIKIIPLDTKSIVVAIVTSLLITAGITGIIYAVNLYREMMEKIRSEEQLKALNAKAELKALQSQINPHFLFNTLNTISTLVKKNPDKAEEVIEKLAEIFRYILISSEKEMISLSKEVEFIDQYLEIEKVRFEDKLNIKKEIGCDTNNIYVPSLILQPIVENAIKHGIAPKIDGGSIDINIFQNDKTIKIQISDTGIKVNKNVNYEALVKNSNGIGLKNVDDRLKKTFGEEYGLKIKPNLPTGVNVEIEIPYNR
jgi:LytS/YehU family sensor histidine kinase